MRTMAPMTMPGLRQVAVGSVLALTWGDQEPFRQDDAPPPIVACSRAETAARVLLRARQPRIGHPRTAGNPAPARP